MKLVIGCPIYKRSWIFPFWAACIERQSISLSNIGFVFETSPDDIETKEVIQRWRDLHPEIPLFEINDRSDIAHFEHQKNSRQWTMSKYHNMISLRNSILKRVREIQPDYYFSLDSDILIKNKNTLELLMKHIDEGADAVNTLMFMTPFDTRFPSVMTWNNDENNRAHREDSYPLGTFFQSDIIMAAKMMSKDTYNSIDYEFHIQGEDLGWCHAAKRAGKKLYCASYIYSPHIMHEEMLVEFTKAGDPREKVIFENSAKI